MTVSSERLVTEIEKVFLSDRPRVALEMFSSIPGLPFDIEHFPLFQKYANGCLNFLWAGYMHNYGHPDEVEEILSRLRLPVARRLKVNYFLSFKKPALKKNFVFMDNVEDVLRFEFVLRLVASRNFRKKFGPYSSPTHKVKTLGFGGEFWNDNGVSGKQIGTALALMEDFALINPLAGAPDFKDYASKLLEEVF